MSRADVEALEGVYAEWREGRFGADAIFDPDVEVRWAAANVDARGTTRGVAALTEVLRRWFDGLQDVRFEAERVIDLGDRVLVVALMRARGRGSGIEVTERYGHLWTLRDGRAVRLEDADPRSANAELTRHFLELGRRGDWTRLELLAPDVVYRPIAETTESGEYRGREGYRRYMDDFFAGDWADDLTYEVTEVESHGDGVVARVKLTGTGRASALPFGARVSIAFGVDGEGRIDRIEDFLDHDEAVRAARAQSRASP